MSIKIVKEDKKEQKEQSKPSFFKTLITKTFLFLSFLFIGLFALYQYLHITEGFTIYISNYDIQTEYARFLIDINEEFIDKMLMYEDVVRNKQTFEDYSEFEKEKLSDIIIAENSILSRLKNTAPNDKNLDYNELYDNITKSYALYIQGQLMQMEYILQTDEGLDGERFTLGESITNLMGNFIIEYGVLSNEIRDTDYELKYSVLDGLGYNLGTAEDVDIERDEDGKLILDEDSTYLYIPEDEEFVIREGEEDEQTVELDQDLINGFIKDFDNIQNKN